MKKFYTEEFKKMTVELSYTSDKPVAEMCKDLGISNSILYRWRKDMSVDAKLPDSQEVKELKKKLSNLELENQILKKALAICNRM